MVNDFNYERVASRHLDKPTLPSVEQTKTMDEHDYNRDFGLDRDASIKDDRQGADLSKDEHVNLHKKDEAKDKLVKIEEQQYLEEQVEFEEENEDINSINKSKMTKEKAEALNAKRKNNKIKKKVKKEEDIDYVYIRNFPKELMRLIKNDVAPLESVSMLDTLVAFCCVKLGIDEQHVNGVSEKAQVLIEDYEHTDLIVEVSDDLESIKDDLAKLKEQSHLNEILNYWLVFDRLGYRKSHFAKPDKFNLNADEGLTSLILKIEEDVPKIKKELNVERGRLNNPYKK